MASETTKMRTRIISAATRLFAIQGFAGTSIQAVSDAVGIRKQSLLYHFSSKEALREGVLDAIFSRWKDVVPKVLLEATSGLNRFENAIAVTVDFFAADRNRAQLVVRELLDRPAEMRDLIRDNLRPWIGLITSYIRRGQERGELHQGVDPESYVHLATLCSVCTIAGAEVFRVIFPDDPTSESAFERLLGEFGRIMQTALFFRLEEPLGDDSDSE